MKLVRSWPEAVPVGRSYVVDGMDRLVMAGYDNSGLAGLDDDVLLVEWDIAVSLEDLHLFADRAAESPASVLVAPYRLYRYGPYWHYARPKPLPDGVLSVWAHRRQDQPGGGFRHVTEADATCHYFGFGLVYLPQKLIAAYQADRAADPMSPDWGFSDGSFSAWHWRVVGEEVPIVWEVRPVHLHYDLNSPQRRTTL